MSTPRVLFVSKAVAPPFHDGASCLVRDLCAGLSRTRATVMTTVDAPEVRDGVAHARIYDTRSKFSPALRDNARVFAHVVTDRSHDLWHFVFAPNPLSSKAGRLLRTVRRVPVIQTVASQPKTFAGVQGLLFGDRVVALSKHTSDLLIRHGVSARRVTVIGPPVADVSRTQEQRDRARRAAGVRDDAPMFVYPGDLEFSGGAATVARSVQAILREVPQAQVIFACRVKTEKARAAGQAVAAGLQPWGDSVRFVGEVEDLPSLLGGATAVLFPVDELYGKVDLPYAVLEAALLEVPVIVADRGPLAELSEAPRIGAQDHAALASWCVRISRDRDERLALGASLRRQVLASYAPSVIAAAYEDVYDSLLS